jgi:predicted  nucleic acid-binding Zn-ribbon protein
MELEVERAQAFAQMERSHATALRRVMEGGDRERASLSLRVSELEAALGRVEESVKRDPRPLDGTHEMETRAQGLEALVASRTEDTKRLEQELDDARTEVPALEAEIAALRTELISLRLQLDDQKVLAQVAGDELDANKEQLAKADRALIAALARVTALEAPNRVQ